MNEQLRENILAAFKDAFNKNGVDAEFEDGDREFPGGGFRVRGSGEDAVFIPFVNIAHFAKNMLLVAAKACERQYEVDGVSADFVLGTMVCKQQLMMLAEHIEESL